MLANGTPPHPPQKRTRTHTHISSATCCRKPCYATLSSASTPVMLTSTLLSSDCMWHANMQTPNYLCCDTFSKKIKTCLWISQVVDPDSSNLVRKTLTDILWGDAVICLDRHCRAGLHDDYEDKQWRQRKRWYRWSGINAVKKKKKSTDTCFFLRNSSGCHRHTICVQLLILYIL